MRSRYSAYALNIPEYIIATTHPANPQYTDNKFSWKKAISFRAQHSTFNKLEILDFKENNQVAIVTFTVFVSQDGQEDIFTERSIFEKINNLWAYRLGHLSEGKDLSLVVEGDLKLLPLTYYNNPMLRKKADPVTKITEDIKTLVEKMIATMDICDGLGLAAPQVNQSLRLFVIRTPIDTGDDKYELGDVQVFINPKLSLPSNETWAAPEGCLSIPTIHCDIVRPKQITVEFTTLTGETISKRVSGWEAKVIMHENDHINGVLFIDRLEPKERLNLDQKIKKLENRINL
jgi:peptide deformylase